MKIFQEIKNNKKEKSIDTGMAAVLVFLFLGITFSNFFYIKIAFVVLLINMICPLIYFPLAILWFSLAHAIGIVMSKIILSIIFFGIVCPVGLFRKLLNKDNLQLKEWKKNNLSVFQNLDKSYTLSDIENPY